MKTAIITINEQKKETGESLIIVDAREVGIILAALEEYLGRNKRNKLAATLVSEFELLPCSSPRTKPSIKSKV